MLCTLALSTCLLFCGEKPASAYTILPGDTLFQIAESVYGEGRLWPDIARANPDIKPNALKPGQVIAIPGKRQDSKAPAAPQAFALSRGTFQEKMGAAPAPASFKTYTFTISKDMDLMITMALYVLMGCLVITMAQSLLFYMSGQIFKIRSVSMLASFKATFLTETTYLFMAGSVFLLTFTIINTLLGKTDLSFYENMVHFWYTLKILPLHLPLLLGILLFYACVGLHYLRRLCDISLPQALLIVFTGSVMPSLGLTLFFYSAFWTA